VFNRFPYRDVSMSEWTFSCAASMALRVSTELPVY